MVRKSVQHNGMECPICLDRTVAVVTRCGHMYCRTCIEDSLRRKPECAVCGSAVDPNTDLIALKSVTDVSTSSAGARVGVDPKESGTTHLTPQPAANPRRGALDLPTRLVPPPRSAAAPLVGAAPEQPRAYRQAQVRAFTPAVRTPNTHTYGIAHHIPTNAHAPRTQTIDRPLPAYVSPASADALTAAPEQSLAYRHVRYSGFTPAARSVSTSGVARPVHIDAQAVPRTQTIDRPLPAYVSPALAAQPSSDALAAAPEQPRCFRQTQVRAFTPAVRTPSAHTNGIAHHIPTNAHAPRTQTLRTQIDRPLPVSPASVAQPSGDALAAAPEQPRHVRASGFTPALRGVSTSGAVRPAHIHRPPSAYASPASSAQPSANAPRQGATQLTLRPQGRVPAAANPQNDAYYLIVGTSDPAIKLPMTQMVDHTELNGALRVLYAPSTAPIAKPKPLRLCATMASTSPSADGGTRAGQATLGLCGPETA